MRRVVARPAYFFSVKTPLTASLTLRPPKSQSLLCRPHCVYVPLDRFSRRHSFRPVGGKTAPPPRSGLLPPWAYRSVVVDALKDLGREPPGDLLRGRE